MYGNGLLPRLKRLLLGEPRNLGEKDLFKRISLAAILAWIGLGSDGLSSSCYGPEECFRALGEHGALAPLLALACMATVAVICASYSQIIEAFPGGGGGYLVASKLLSPSAGAISGCALLVDYVLTIAISIASGADAAFSLLPPSLAPWKTPFALAAVALLTAINLRGVRESVMIWAPVFFVFIATHAAALAAAFFGGAGELPQLAAKTANEMGASFSTLGAAGTFLLLAHAYAVGAGTYTGIEAVSNGLPVLREPRVETGKRTMLYMGLSLALLAGGLLVAYRLCEVAPKEGMTLNAVLFSKLTASWPFGGGAFLWAAMLSAAALLFVAAQTGFLDGPRVLANMALDRWLPARFALLSDRLVAWNGILIMGLASFVVLLAANGSVSLLVVLYSINVFISFTLSQTGMALHWWRSRREAKGWAWKLALNGAGASLTGFILATICFVKFWEGGWMTLLATGVLAALAFLSKRHYAGVSERLARLDKLAEAIAVSKPEEAGGKRGDGTAVLFVNGFNGLGLHTLFAIRRVFPKSFGRFVFLQAGIVDAGNFKGAAEIDALKRMLEKEGAKYVDELKRLGFEAEAFHRVGNDLSLCASELAAEAAEKYPDAVFFGGQLVFEKESFLDRIFHNYAVFSIQKNLYRKGLPMLIMPLKL